MTSPKTTYDLIVIGTGVAASTVAWQCHSAGWKIAVIDSRPFGGTCALRGCDPKKVLVGIAELIDWHHRMESKGVDHAKEIQINWSELMHFKRSFTEPVPKRREQEFSEAEIDTFHGHARFTSHTALEVELKEKFVNQELSAKHILIATGAKPAKLNIPGEEYITISDQFLELDNLPKRIAFVGGGYISFEFAHIAARAGAHVTILHRTNKPLGQFDPDLVNQLVLRTRELGVDVKLETAVKGIVRTTSGLVVQTSSYDNNEERTIEADMVVHGAGRVPDIEGLDLPSAGIDYELKKGIKVNDYLQSVSNPAIYAAGDAVASGGPQLTPVATYDGEIVATNLLKGNHLKPNYKGVPSVVFTIPPLASVGLQEETAKQQGLHFKMNYDKNTSRWYSSRRVGENYSGFKVLIEEDGGRILGAHLLGSHVEEVINIFALAIRLGLAVKDIKEVLFSYPTISSDISYML